ncbi:MAG: hypothetical protein WC073_04255 [Sterolibacterium sp.]
MSPQAPQKNANANAIAAAWRASLAQAAAAPLRVALPQEGKDLAIAVVAEFVAATIQARQTLLLVVPDDEWLPELSNALDLALRPLCLVLPGPGFAADIALRATLSLLKSRLSRGGEASCADAWETQRRHLEQHAELWQAALDWSTSSIFEGSRPARIGELFPVCVLAATQAEALAVSSRDAVLLLHSERLSAFLPHLPAYGKCVLLLHDAAPGASGELVRVDEGARLKLELEMLVQELGDMELEFATVQAELAEFTREYHARVGSRMIELDALQARIARRYAERIATDEAAQRQAEQAQAQAERSQREHRRFTELDQESEKPFAPSTDLKRLFRQLAQKIHPDRATDEIDRAWRSELMSEANRAYRAGDEMVLHDILSQWQTGRPEQRAQKMPATPPQGLAQQVARMQRRLAEIEADLNRLIASRLYELFAAANLARQRGRDLLQELAEQLDAQIAAARLRLEQLEAA